MYRCVYRYDDSPQLRPLPDVPYTVRVAARNTLGSSGWGDAAIWRVPAAGYCANRNDLPIFRDQRSTLKHSIQMGLIDCERSMCQRRGYEQSECECEWSTCGAKYSRWARASELVVLSS